MTKISSNYPKYHSEFGKLRRYKSFIRLIPFCLAIALGTGAMLIWEFNRHNLDQVTFRLFSTIHGLQSHPQEIVIVSLAPSSEHTSSDNLPRAEGVVGLEKTAAFRPSELVTEGDRPEVKK